MSQKDVALECEWDKERYRDLENGKTLRPRPETLVKLATALGVEMADITLEIGQIPDPHIQEFYANTKKGGTYRPMEIVPVATGQGVFAIDVDGVLLQGFDFSWRLIWDYCGYDDEVRRKAMRAYLNGGLGYAEWLDYCVDHFKQRRLKKSDFAEIVENVIAIKNLEEGLSEIRKMGYLTAIVSGSIDCFIEAKIPTYRNLFDHVFLNRFVFDRSEYLQRGEATPFDFEGKAECISNLCRQHGLSEDQSIYVGDSLNDRAVAGKVGFTIACNSNDMELSHTFSQQIETDDMMDIARTVANWRYAEKTSVAECQPAP